MKQPKHISELVKDRLSIMAQLNLNGKTISQAEEEAGVRISADIHPVDTESPAEWSLARQLKRFADCSVIPQHQAGGRRADFVLEKNGKVIAVEVDGKEYHNTEKDSIRDRGLMTHYDDIIRFAGTDAIYTPSLCVWFLSRKYPWFFIADATGLLAKQFTCEGIYTVADEIKIESYPDSGYNVHSFLVEYLTETIRQELENMPLELIEHVKDHTVLREVCVRSMTATGQGVAEKQEVENSNGG